MSSYQAENEIIEVVTETLIQLLENHDSFYILMGTPDMVHLMTITNDIPMEDIMLAVETALKHKDNDGLYSRDSKNIPEKKEPGQHLPNSIRDGQPDDLGYW